MVTKHKLYIRTVFIGRHPSSICALAGFSVYMKKQPHVLVQRQQGCITGMTRETIEMVVVSKLLLLKTT